MGHSYLLAAAVMLVCLSGAARGAAAQDSPQRAWSQIGAAGVPDESSAPVRFGSNGAVALGLSVGSPARAVLRYNIPAVDGLFATGGEDLPLCLHVRYRDTGGDARVVVRIRRVIFRAEPGEPDIETLISFDSNSREQAPHYMWATVCSQSLTFHFYENAYFADVELFKLGPGGDPGVHALGIRLDFQ